MVSYQRLPLQSNQFLSLSTGVEGREGDDSPRGKLIESFVAIRKTHDVKAQYPVLV